MLARFRTRPWEVSGSATPAASNHCDQALLSSRCSSGDFSRSDGLVMRLRPDISLGLQTGKSLLGAKADSVEPAPIAVAVPDRHVDFLSHEFDMMHGRGDAQIDDGMGLTKW